MSIKFEAQILDSMVDENGHCGERGMSKKQWDILAPYMDGEEAKNCGGWTGSNGGGVQFWERDAWGTIGKYNVQIHLFMHFNLQVVVKSIDRWIEEVPTFEDSQWQYEPKKRVDLELTLIRETHWDQPSYSGYGYDRVNLYTFADADGNCYIWKTGCYVEVEREDEDGTIDYTIAKCGDKVSMKATITAHNEYRGIQQTVLTRCKVNVIR